MTQTAEPTPRSFLDELDVPFGVVAPQAVAEQAVSRLERLPGEPLDPRTVADAAAAREQITDRRSTAPC